MRGSIRQFSMLEMKQTLIEMLNGLWNKNKARRIFLEARLHSPTPASADGKGSQVSTPSTSCCHTAPEIYTRLSAAARRKAWLKQGACPNWSTSENSSPKEFKDLISPSANWGPVRALKMPAWSTRGCMLGISHSTWEGARWDLLSETLTASSFAHLFSWYSN